jgi:hypothetical protein
MRRHRLLLQLLYKSFQVVILNRLQLNRVISITDLTLCILVWGDIFRVKQLLGEFLESILDYTGVDRGDSIGCLGVNL